MKIKNKVVANIIAKQVHPETKDLKNYFQDIPKLIIKNGLCNAIAFFYGKAGKKKAVGNAYKQAIYHLLNIMQNQNFMLLRLKNVELENMPAKIRALRRENLEQELETLNDASMKYLNITRDVIDYFELYNDILHNSDCCSGEVINNQDSFEKFSLEEKIKTSNFYLRFNVLPKYTPEIQNVTWSNNENKFLKEMIEEYKTSIKNLKETHEVKILTFKLNQRMVIGLGDTSIYDSISIHLHYIYGFPIIPGSAIKGTTKNYLILQTEKNEEKTKEKHSSFVPIFGEHSKDNQLQGKVIFFDAYPENLDSIIEKDVMAPHKGKTVTPIFFLTARKNSTFSIPLAIPKKDASLLDTCVRWVEQALDVQGVGAKTALGYGVGTVSVTD